MDSVLWTLASLYSPKYFPFLYRIPHFWGKKKVKSETEWKKCKLFCLLTLGHIAGSIYCGTLFLRCQKYEDLCPRFDIVAQMICLLFCTETMVMGFFECVFLKQPRELGQILQQLCTLLRRCRNHNHAIFENKKDLDKLLYCGMGIFGVQMLNMPGVLLFPFVTGNMDPSFFALEAFYDEQKQVWIGRNFPVTCFRSLIIFSLGLHALMSAYLCGIYMVAISILGKTTLKYLTQNPKVPFGGAQSNRFHMAIQWYRHTHLQRMQRYRALFILFRMANNILWPILLTGISADCILIIICAPASIKHFHDLPILAWLIFVVVALVMIIIGLLISTWFNELYNISCDFVNQCKIENLSKAQRRVAKSLLPFGMAMGPFSYFSRETTIGVGQWCLEQSVTVLLL